MAACLCFRAISPQLRLHLNRGKKQRQEEQVKHVSLSRSLTSYKVCCTAQMLHSHFQEIISDWEGQHPVAVGEARPVFCVVASAMLCVPVS